MAATPNLLTANDLLRMPGDGWRYELVQGELHRLPPPGYRHGRTASRIGSSLSSHAEKLDLGVVLAAETGFLLSTDPDEVRAADAAFVTKEHLDATSFDPESYFPGAPDLVVEVVSPSDSYTQVQEKVLLWLRSGARCVVIADPERQLFVVHRPHSEPVILTAADTLTIPDVVPGWEFRVGEAFPPK
ncbi:MAG TPA: Uma2 family endonuclease [Thermoanaerobaculia bacterium]|nr:Uma2 family endonuclease [Thermoanaerobaculia bacterium]